MFFLRISVLLLTVLACSNCDSTIIDTETASGHIPEVDSTVRADTSLFMITCTFARAIDSVDAGQIRVMSSKIEGIRAMSISLSNRTCTFYLDTFELYKSIFASLKRSGFELEDQFIMGGPGISCNIPAELSTDSLKTEANISVIQRSLSHLKDQFNKHHEKVRVLSIPNPSCLACVKGQRFINSLFAANDSANGLIGLTIWTSIEGWGKRKDADRLGAEFNDQRLIQFWDAEMQVGRTFKEPLGINTDYPTAWDVYMIFEPGIRWGDEPPEPTFWMHQLESTRSGVDSSLFLDHKVFASQLNRVLATTF